MKKVLLFLTIILNIPSFSQTGWLNSDKLFENLAFRKNLANQGIDLTFEYKGEVFSNISGGNEKKSFYLDNFDIVFDLDMEKLFGFSGTSSKIYFLGNNGEIPSEATNTLQGTSNIAAYNTWKLYEFWIGKNFSNGKFSILAGLYDLNSEFDTRESSGLYINPSHGIGPDFSQAGENGPSIFPNTALAVRLKYTPAENIYAMAAVFDGIPGDLNNHKGTHIILDNEDGVLIAYEMGLISEKEYGEGYYKVSLGFWHFTGEFEYAGEPSNANATQNGNTGLYLSAEKFLYAKDNNPSEGLAGFIRLGWADKEINPFEYYFGSGLTYTGLLGDDQLGFAVAAGFLGSPYKSHEQNLGNNVANSEIIFELTYEFKVIGSVKIQPDIQYAINPGCSKDLDNSLIVGSRLNISL